VISAAPKRAVAPVLRIVPQPGIEAQDVVRRFRKTLALDGVSLSAGRDPCPPRSEGKLRRIVRTFRNAIHRFSDEERALAEEGR
jgi:hypothetical protein